LNPYIQSIILGIVEGLTEFLPVSSTAHLRISEALMNIPLDDAYWKMYTIVIQLGAILALLLLFLGRIVGFLRTFPRGENGDRNWLTHPISLTFIAFAVTSAPALLLHKWSEKNLGSITAMAWALLIGGIVMWIIDAWAARRESTILHVDLKKEVFPSGGATAHVVMTTDNWIVLLIGLVVSFFVALGVVEWFLFWVRKHGFTIFAIYRILLGAALLLFGAKFIGS
jgi:undecaprenyl pyrophosphate phosphatase UppP